MARFFWLHLPTKLDWDCRECTKPASRGQILATDTQFVAMDQDERPIVLCPDCWASQARRGVASDGFVGIIREYHAHQAVQP